MEPRARLQFDARIRLPSHALFVGATQSGKTRLCLHLLSKPELFEPKPARILFHYDQFQDAYLETKERLDKEHGIQLLLFKGCDGINLDDLDKSEGQTILLIDDFSEETSSSKEIARIATNGRHKNVSLWLVWHSLFAKHEASRRICQNVRWFFFLPSPRLESQLRTFGSQLGMTQRLLSAYAKCLEPDSSESAPRYLVADVGPTTPDLLRLRTAIDGPIQYCFT